MSDIDSNYSGDGYQTIIGTLFVNPDYYAEQKVEIYMKTTIPIEIAETMDDMTVMNYISFQDFEDDDAEPTKLVCTTKIGDKYKHAVYQYAPEADLAA